MKSGAVLFAKDPERLARFYGALAGLTVTHSAKDIIVLESAGHQLMLHPIPARIARKIMISVPPRPRAEAVTKLVFAVPSIADVRDLAPTYGGSLNPPGQMFEARGFRACDGTDPEGNIIQFREPAGPPEKPVVRKSSRAGVDYATVRELALALPDVVDGSTLRGIGFRLKGRLLACKAIHRSAEPETLMVRVGAADRDRLIAADPAVFYLTPHYLVNASVLVRLRQVSRKALADVLESGRAFVASETPAPRRKSARRK